MISNYNEHNPDFIIVGSHKSGTSTLASYLRNHPSIWIPEHEVAFFSKNFQWGMEWYRKRIIEGLDRSNKSVSLIGEKTPAYSYLPYVPQRMISTVPKVKIIWIFRNPVERTYSNYLQLRKKGREPFSFKKAIEKEKIRINKNIYYGYVERSKYILQVKRFLKIYPFNQMCFVLFEELISQPEKCLRKLVSFLDIDYFPNDLPRIHSNKTLLPRYGFTLWATGMLFGYHSPFFNVVHRINYTHSKEKQPLDENIRQYLEVVFKPFNQELAEVTGLDISWWNLNNKNSDQRID